MLSWEKAAAKVSVEKRIVKMAKGNEPRKE